MRRPVTLLIFTLMSFLLYACGDDAQSSTGDNENEDPSIPVEVSMAGRGSVAAYFAGSATLEAEEEATVVARTEGIVEQIMVEEGDFVQEGRILARLARHRLEKQAAQAEANLRRLENDYLRSKELYEKNLISAEEFQRTLSDFEAQKATFDLARLELDYTDIRAPIGGIVSERMIKIGNMLAIHEPVFRITDFNPLHAILHVPERESGKLAMGQETHLTVDAHPDVRFQGKILRISPVVDPASGTVKVTVAVGDETGRLKPGMFARVSIIYDVHDNTLVVPKQAVLLEDEESAVYVVRDSMSFRQTVRTGYANGSTIEILAGLDDGDTVVTIGQGALKDSARVEVINIQQTAHHQP